MSVQSPPVSIWYFLIGGGFIGFWLYILLFEPSDWGIPTGEWLVWGLFGIVLAASLYLARIANEQMRIAIWIFDGLLLGLLIAASIFGRYTGIVATFVTGAGAGLIVAGFPASAQHNGWTGSGWQPSGPQGPVDEAPPEDEAAAEPRWRQEQSQGGSSQQQGVYVTRR